MSLATKYRPKDFNELVGQNEVTTILMNELQNNKVKQAYIFEGGSGLGKAQPLYSKILTNNGYVNMGDIKVNDNVFGDDGKLHKVLGVFPQGIKNIYEVTFSDGSTCRCSDEHLWTVSKNHGKSWVTITLSDIMNYGLCRRPHNNVGKDGHGWIFKIPITKPIIFDHVKELKIDPWLFGVLIGDGGFTDNTIQLSNYENDIINRVKGILSKNGFELTYMTKYHKEKKDFRIKDKKFNKDTSTLSRKNGIFGNRLLQYIYDYGLLNKKSSEKHIPKDYLFSSYENRLKLLQGIFDTDGTINTGNSFCLSTSSKQLANDLIFLVQSLGGTASCNEHETYYTYNGKKLKGLNNYEFYIKLPKDVVPFTSEKHKKRYKKSSIGVYRTIRNIKYIGKEPCQCIYIDNPTHLYLTDNMIVTHNTTMSSILANKLNGLTVNYDVAINNSVDDIKQLLEYVKQKPIDKDKVIVILDEVQNIFNRKDSPAAQALLKILEQPPKHVIFIMCTTEGDKIIDTIKNRCETLHFGAISVDDIANRLQYICNQEHIIFDSVESLKEIAKRSDGSMRNAITNLEKLSSLGNITIANVTKTLASKYDDMFKLLYAYFDEDINTIVSIINNIDDIDKFVSAFFTFVLDIGVFMKTHNINLTSLPTIFKDDLVFRGGEQQDVLYLISNMIELQYHGRNNPIMKSLFKAVLFRRDNDN